MPLSPAWISCASFIRLQTRRFSSKPSQLAKLVSSAPTRSPPIGQQLSAYLERQHSSRRTRRTTPANPVNPPTPAMSFLLPGLRRGLILSSPLVLSAPLLAYQYRHTRPILCDSPDPLAKLGDLRNQYSHDAQTPVITQSGAANPRAVRQISMGSILGVLGGLGISVFSKPLAILIGLGVVLVQVRLVVLKTPYDASNAPAGYAEHYTSLHVTTCLHVYTSTCH